MNQPLITVFTPAYNRARTLPGLYESLQQQNDRSFEWLIVDDGSTDDTEKTVEKFSRDAFAVRYVKKENGGKHTAYNLALQKARGMYFLCVDSDDLLAPGAVAALRRALQPGLGLCAYKAARDGRLLGAVFPDGVACAATSDLSARLGCGGEYAFVYPTQVARRVPFPVFAGERFVTERVVYDRLDHYCAVKLLPEVVAICEYQPDGYSADTDKLMRENPAGYCLYFMQRIDRAAGLAQRVAAAGKYRCFGRMAGPQRSAYHGAHRVLVGLCAPLGVLFQIYYRLFRNF